jgi:hypothetical protein
MDPSVDRHYWQLMRDLDGQIAQQVGRQIERLLFVTRRKDHGGAGVLDDDDDGR